MEGTGICTLQLPCRLAVQGKPVGGLEMHDQTGEGVARARLEGACKSCEQKKNILPVRRLIPTHSKYGCIIGRQRNRVSAARQRVRSPEVQARKGGLCLSVAGCFGFPDSAAQGLDLIPARVRSTAKLDESKRGAAGWGGSSGGDHEPRIALSSGRSAMAVRADARCFPLGQNITGNM